VLESMLIAAKCSDVGVVREHNEDAATIDVIHLPGLDAQQSAILAAVADGMGGHASGEIASRIAIDSFKETISSLLMPGIASISNFSMATTQAINNANAQVYKAGKDDPENHGMGTTLTTAIVVSGVLYVGHVGDSRAYLIRNGAVRQLTHDHSVVQEKLDEGLITAEEAAQSDERNLLRKAIGIRSDVTADATIEELYDDDVIILCTDGLYNSVGEQDFIDAVAYHQNPQAICDALVESAKVRDGSDNITVVCLMMRPSESTPRNMPQKHAVRIPGRIMLGMMLLLVLVLICLTISYILKKTGEPISPKLIRQQGIPMRGNSYRP